MFEGIESILKQSMIGFEYRATKAMVHVQITNKSKLASLFRQASTMDFLEKKTGKGHKASVKVNPKSPFNLSYSKSKERIFITLHYSWVNKYGVPQK